MATWYSVADSAEQSRLVAAWPDAPIINLEVCEFILETAMEQVVDFAPTVTGPVYEPVTVTWPDGSTVDLTRAGDVVTASIVVAAGHDRYEGLPAPEVFAPSDAYYSVEGTDVGVTFATDLIYIFPGGAVDGQVQYLAAPAAGDGVRSRYVFAQLQQARNLWNSGRTTGEGDVGADGFVFRPYPLDKTIKQIIRPVDGKPHVL